MLVTFSVTIQQSGHGDGGSIQSGNEIALKISVHEVQYLALFRTQPITVTECSSILCIQIPHKCGSVARPLYCAAIADV